MTLLISISAAVIPGLILLSFFHAKDRFPEPPALVWTTFVLGVLCVVPVLIVGLPAAMFVQTLPAGVVHALGLAFLTAAIPEEVLKYSVVAGYSARHDEFDEPMDGLVYGVAASLGFATLENILYVMQGGLGVAVMRALTSLPCHAGLGAIMGYYVGLARFTPPGRRAGLKLRALLVPIVLHGLYDFPLMLAADLPVDSAASPAMGGAPVLGLIALAVLAVIWFWAMSLAAKLRRIQSRRPASFAP